jgi:hypothetical protein
VRDDRVDDALQVGVGAGDDPAEQVALAAHGVHLEHLRDAAEVGHDALPAAALRDLQRHERGDDEAERARVDVRAEAGDDAPGLQPVQPRLGRAAGHAEPPGALEHADPGLLGQQGDQPGVQLVELGTLSSARGLHGFGLYSLINVRRAACPVRAGAGG